MRVTIIPEDRWIRRDDAAANLPEWSFDDAGIHAIQWYGEEGEIEHQGRPQPPNEPFTDPSILDPYLAALDTYLEEQAQLLAEEAQLLAEEADTETP
jgi:hypothetical protein